MRLIVDAQLPVKLCEILKQLGLESIHVDQLPKGDESTDMEMALGRPKKLFLITTGNLKNRQLFDLFRNNAFVINNALNKSSFVELSNEGIIEHE
ncbi:MAG: hypothetical protein WD426_11150 [Anditalea sp.]